MCTFSCHSLLSTLFIERFIECIIECTIECSTLFNDLHVVLLCKVDLSAKIVYTYSKVHIDGKFAKYTSMENLRVVVMAELFVGTYTEVAHDY